MGRRLSSAIVASFGSHTGLSALPRFPGQLPLFGSGQVEVILASRDFIVPESGQYRIRVMAGGADPTTAGQASSFADLISATGGLASVGANGGVGGSGLGGDFQASGGRGGNASAEGHFYGGGGGAAGTQLGDGGNGGNGILDSHSGQVWQMGGGGGGVGGHAGGTGAGYNTNSTSAGGSPLGPAEGTRPGPHWGGHGDAAPGLAMVDALAPPTFHFVGGAGSGQGGRGAAYWVQSSAMHQSNGTKGAVGGGGGGGGGATVDTVLTSLMGGGAGGFKGRGGGGGGGFAMGVFNLDAGDTRAVTVAQIISGTKTSPGIVIVEW